MSNDWMIDVLADLKAVAKMQGMDATAASIEDASLIALAELSAAPLRPQEKGMKPQGETERHSGNVTTLFPKRNCVVS